MTRRTEPDWDEQHRKAAERMRQVDAMPPDVRELIHEFDVNPVVDAYQHGLDTPARIRATLRQGRRPI